MPGTLTPNEEAQLQQTIEMFEVITQSQPSDYQSLEILKEAYFKLGRQRDVVNTAKRIAQAYVQQGQLSSAILEYESILQLFPGDPDVQNALAEIENRATNFGMHPPALETDSPARTAAPAGHAAPGAASAEVDDGRQSMFKIFVEGKHLPAAEFEACWPDVHPFTPAPQVLDPFLSVLAQKDLIPLEQSLKFICEKSRLCYIPLERYDVDIDVARSFPRDVCRRWCVLPFDRIGKTILVATANPFNKQAARDLEKATKSRLLYYLASPAELVKAIRKILR